MKRHGLYNDDWFNLGRLLALNYNKNWDDRGTKKGIALHDTMMNTPDPTDEDMENASAAERNKLMQNPARLTDLIPNEYKINPNGNASDNGTPGSFTAMIPQEYRVNPSGVTPDTNSGGLLSKMFPKAAEKQPAGFFSEFLQNQSDRANAIRVATTPDESKVRELAAQQAKLKNDESFNAEEYLARLNKVLLQQGLSPESREAVMKQATADAAAKQRGLYEQKSDGLLTEYNSLMKNGNYDEAFALLPQIAKYNQPAAQMLYGSGVTPKELFNKAIHDEDFVKKVEAGKIDLNNKMELMKFQNYLTTVSLEDQIKIKQKYGLNTGGKNNQGHGGYSKAQVDMANDVFSRYMKHLQEGGDENNFPLREQLKISQQIRDDILTGGRRPQREITIPNELQGFIGKLTPNSTSKDILAAYLEDEQIQDFLANNPQYIEWFENQTGLVFPRKNTPKNNNSNNNFVAQSNNGQDTQRYWGD